MAHAEPAVRLPLWTWPLIVAGAALTYVGVGVLLQGVRFVPDMESLWDDPVGFTNGQSDIIAPFVLLLGPAVLGGLAVRSMLRVLFAGLRRGDAPGTIAKALAAHLGGLAMLLVLALYSSGVKRH